MRKIPLFKPPVGKEEVAALAKIFKAGWIGLGPKTAEFEQKFAAYTGTKHAVGLNSCTAALHLALQIYGIGPGDEVLVPTVTFVSTAHAALYNGATPVFVDMDPEHLCVDVADMERKITRRTKAVIPVHFGGHPCDMDPIMAIARKRKLIVIEDCANSCGTEYKGRKVGSIGHMGCFSFEAKKNMTTGDGGMITTNDSSKVERLKQLRWVGINKDTWKRFSSQGNYSWYYEVSEAGLKYNMNDIQASMGLVQLAKLDRLNDIKRGLIARYKEELSGLPWLRLPTEMPWAKGYYWLFVIQVPERERFIQHMADKGVTTGVHFMPVHLHPLYRKCKTRAPNAERIWKSFVTLPLYSSMTPSEQAQVIGAVKSFKPKGR